MWPTTRPPSSATRETLDVTPGPQGSDQAGLVLPAEGEPVHLPDGVVVRGHLGTDDRAHGVGPDDRNSSRTRMRIWPSMFLPLPSPPSPQ